MVINQIAAIGDILFIEPICRNIWHTTGQKPLLPIRDHLMWLSDYIESAEIIPMSKFSFDIDSDSTDNPNYLPLRFANPIIRKLNKWDYGDYENCMMDKYELAKIDPLSWLGMDLKFNFTKSLKLMTHLGLTQSSEYILINNHSQAGKINIKPENRRKLPIVEMKEVPGYNVLDWAAVILHAKENHHVSTSTFFIMQAIANKFSFDSKVFIYPRPNEDGLRGISKLNPTFKLIRCE